MSDNNIHGTFISEKPNKIRWKPEELYESQSFLTGSWDNEVNTIKLWTFTTTEEDPAIYPFVLESFEINGDVTEIQFITSEVAVASSSEGDARLFSVRNDHQGAFELKEKIFYDNLHYFNNGEISPCTGLATYDEDIATIGEDGRINLLSTRQSKPLRTIEADSCSLKSICFLRHNEILTGNMRGQMKVWDLRSQSPDPVNNFMLSGGQQLAATCLTYHPTQRHVVLAGSEDGSITVWDLRQSKFSVTTLLKGHSSAISEIHFHPNRPDKLFTCTVNGELWSWNSSAKRVANNKLLMNMDFVDENVWLSSDLGKDKLEILSLMPDLYLPVNSLSVNRDKVLCGCDNEAIYVIRNIDY